MPKGRYYSKINGTFYPNFYIYAIGVRRPNKRTTILSAFKKNKTKCCFLLRITFFLFTFAQYLNHKEIFISNFASK
jgi:hypothetical protein